MDIGVFQQFWDHPVLHSTMLTQLTTYIRLAAHLKQDILLPQPLEMSDPECVPDVLPQAVALFLSKCIDMPFEYMEYFWDVLKYQVWATSPTLSIPEDLALFKEFGWELNLSMSGV